MKTEDERNVIGKEILDVLPKNPHGRLGLSPRLGKTKIVIDIIKRDKPESILWVTPTSKLAKEDIPEEFSKWKAKRYLNKLTCVTWRGLEKIKGYYDLIVLDEEQFITENNSKNLLNGQLLYNNIISMSGTPSKSFNEVMIYRRLGLETLYSVSIIEATDLGILSDYQINVITVPLDTRINIEVKTKKVEFKTSEYSQYKYLDKQVAKSGGSNIFFKMLSRMKAIYESRSKFEVAKYLMDNLEGRKLFFCPRAKQAEELSENFYHGKTDGTHLRKFIDGEVDNIAMVNKGGTGYTYKNIDHLVLVQADSDSSGLTSQKISRTLLKQKDYKAQIWIICLEGTQDEVWVKSAMANFDEKKIKYIPFSEYKK